MKSKERRHTAFLLLLISAFIFPLQVTAAGKSADIGEDTVTRERVFVAESEKEYKKLAAFEAEIKEDGKAHILKDISYEVLSKNYLDKKEKTIESSKAPAEIFMEDGQEFRLVRSEKVERIVSEPSVEPVYMYEDYDWPVTAESVPVTKEMAVTDSMTDRSENVICSFNGIVPAGTKEVANQMTVTFQNYDASYYEWNGNYIPRDDGQPALGGYEEELLASVDAMEGSRIEGIAWAGEPYLDQGGVLCRDAVAQVYGTVQLYRANYQGSFPMDGQKEAVYKCVYETPDIEGRVEYKVSATGIYEEKPSILPYILTGAGVLLLIILLIAILMLIVRKKGKKKNGIA